MKNIKFGAFFLGLALAVSGAVSLLYAQDRVERPRQSRGDVLVFDGRGAQLGVRVSDVDPSTSPGAGATAAGVRIEEVNAGSPAERAGLREGDIVVEFDGERVRSARQFSRLVQETPDGRTVRLAVMRNGQKQTLDATPEAGRMSWNFGIDADQLKAEIERGLRDLPEPRTFDFRFDDRGPRRFEYRMPEMVMPYLGSRARLGVSIQSLTPELEDYFGARDGGVLVTSVSQESLAAKAGVKAGDVITAINGTRVRGARDFLAELRDASGEITISVIRDKQELTLRASQ